MGVQIESGTGNGFQAGVDSENRIKAICTTHTLATHVSEMGDCYFWTTAYNYAAADTILWLANTSTSKMLLLEKIHIASDATTQFTVHSPAYLAPAGTLITGTNANRAAGKVAAVVCYQDETNNVQGDILVEGLVLTNTEKILPIDGKIVLGYQHCIAVDFVTVGTMGIVVFVGYFL